MPDQRPITVVELSEFQAAAASIFTQAERTALADHVSAHPDLGKVIPGTGGVRKLRWKSKGKGKRSGARVIYYFLAAKETVYRLTAYGKKQKEDLSAKEEKDCKIIVEMLTAQVEE